MKEIDQLVGRRIKERRRAIGMTQTELASAINVRFQQVQKYENGQNRVAASRLWQIARALDIHIGYFFEEITENVRSDAEDAVMERRKRELVSLFVALSEPKQAAVLSFLRSVND